MIKIKVLKWISNEECEQYGISIGGMGGFFNEGMRWNNYYDDLKEEVKPYANALREDIVKNNIRLTGEGHRYSENGVPLFSDNTIGSFTFRAWGDLMAAVWSEEENKDYCYMNFYM